MNIGIFAKTFPRPTLAATLDAVQAHGLNCVQFNWACAGLPSMPDAIDDELIRQVRDEMESRAMTIAAVSGTFNMAHPDPSVRAEGLRRLRVIAAACAGIGARVGTRVITLCTGTRDPHDMWKRHPDNDTAEAWADMIDSISHALRIADEFNLTLGFEPEVANIIDTAAKGRRLLDELPSPRLKVVMDAANLFRAGDLARMDAVLTEAFNLLGGDIILAHAKDLSHDGAAGHEAAGTGVLDYDLYLKLLRTSGYSGPLILHSLSETQVDAAVAFLRTRMATA